MFTERLQTAVKTFHSTCHIFMHKIVKESIEFRQVFKSFDYYL